MWRAFAALVLLTLFASAAFADLYSWTDERGVFHMVDDPNRLPERYRQGPQQSPSPPADMVRRLAEEQRRLQQRAHEEWVAAMTKDCAGNNWVGGVGWGRCSAEPRGFRGVPWGASETTLHKTVPLVHCIPADPRVDYGTRRCRATEDIEIGDVRPRELWFYLREDHLIGWRLLYGAERRAMMRAALVQRFGEPLRAEHTQVDWKLRGGEVRLEIGSHEDAVTVVSRDELEHLASEAARRDAAARDAARKAARGL